LIQANLLTLEHAKNLLNDFWRIRQLRRNISRLDHPFHRFSTGDSNTLGIDVDSQGLNIRNGTFCLDLVLIDFYKANYSSHLTKVVIYSSHSLDMQEQAVVSLFSNVPRNASAASFSSSFFPLAREHQMVPLSLISAKSFCEARQRLQDPAAGISNTWAKKVF
jgi:insulysin